jgi:hypothetical protein
MLNQISEDALPQEGWSQEGWFKKFGLLSFVIFLFMVCYSLAMMFFNPKFHDAGGQRLAIHFSKWAQQHYEMIGPLWLLGVFVGLCTCFKSRLGKVGLIGGLMVFLFWIPVSGFLEFQFRASVHLVRTRMDSVATQLTDYQQQHGQYPASLNDLPDMEEHTRDLYAHVKTSFRYLSNEQTAAIIAPGLDMGDELQLDENQLKFSEDQLNQHLAKYLYDPTNGTLSSGGLVLILREDK